MSLIVEFVLVTLIALVVAIAVPREEYFCNVSLNREQITNLLAGTLER